MNNWQVDLFTGLQQAHNMQDVVDVALHTVRPMGFDYVFWRWDIPLPMTEKKRLGINTQDDKAMERVISGDYDNAPVPKHCSQSEEPIYYSGTTDEAIFLKAPDLWEEYHSWGHRGGWAQSIIEGSGIFSIFHVDSKDIVDIKYLKNISFHLQWITIAVHSTMSHLRSKPTVSLSTREKEVLRWTGDGKTADQIAEILMLSPSTINFHLRNAMMKLDAPNKTAAVVRAIFLGLLH